MIQYKSEADAHIKKVVKMAASSAADIPESKSDYCPCNRCTVARKQGKQEIILKLRELIIKYTVIGDYEDIPQEEILKLLEGK
jgi:hypothetical protein